MDSKGLVRIVLSGIITAGSLSLDSGCAAQTAPPDTAQRVSVKQDSALEKEYKKCLSEIGKQRIFDPSVFSVLTEKAPDNAQAHMILGNALLISEFTPDNYKKAIEEFDRALELSPNTTSIYVNRGLAHYVAVEPTGRIPAYMITRENMPEEFVRGAELAIIDFDTAIKRNPKLFSAYFNKGVILKIIGREREAVPIFEKAIKLGLEKRVYSSPTVANEDDVEFVGTGHPMMTMSGIRKYLIDEKLSFKRKEGKIVILSRTNPFISNENDAIAFAYYHQGSALASANMKDYPKALSCFDKAIEQNPNIPTFYAVKGVIYAGLGNADQMFENLNQQKALMDRIIRIKNSEE